MSDARVVPSWATRARARWRYTGVSRPHFALVPGAQQESVWDYPRPPRWERDRREVSVRLPARAEPGLGAETGAAELARSHSSVRVLETAGPPTFYLPPADVQSDRLERAPGSSRCEWKGEAVYWRLRPGQSAEASDTLEFPDAPVAWSYPDPFPGFEAIRGWFAFYPSRLDCWLDGIRVEPQPGGFYGGWVTPELAGPFKGEPGSEDW